MDFSHHGFHNRFCCSASYNIFSGFLCFVFPKINVFSKVHYSTSNELHFFIRHFFTVFNSFIRDYTLKQNIPLKTIKFIYFYFNTRYNLPALNSTVKICEGKHWIFLNDLSHLFLEYASFHRIPRSKTIQALNKLYLLF